MGLFERLIENEDPTVGIQSFASVVAELLRGELDRGDIVEFFDLSVVDAQELDDIIDFGVALPAARQFEYSTMLRETLMLSQQGIVYTDRDSFFQRLQEFS